MLYKPWDDAVPTHSSVAERKAKNMKDFLRILACWVIYDSGKVSLEHLLLLWYPS